MTNQLYPPKPPLSSGAKAGIVIAVGVTAMFLLSILIIVAFSIYIQAKTDAEEADPSYRTRQEAIVIFNDELERRGVPDTQWLLSLGLNTCDLIEHNDASMDSLARNISKEVPEQYVDDVLYSSVYGFCPEYLPAVEEYLQ